MQKLFYEEKEKIQNNIEQQNLDINLLYKLYFLFKKYITINEEKQIEEKKRKIMKNLKRYLFLQIKRKKK